MTQRSLCLRIPSSSEICSPCKPKSKTKLDHSQSLSKPCSPKAKEHSFQNLPLARRSALDRLTDSKALKLGSLPKFLTTSIELSKSLSPKSKKNNFLVSSSIDCVTDSSSIPSQEQVRCSSPVTLDQSDFISSLKSTLQPDEVLLSFGKKKLTRVELQSCVRSSLAECNFIDTCLLVFKHVNRKRFRIDESYDRVAVIQTDISKQIILGDQGSQISIKRNPLKYEFIIIPVFIKHWMLILLDTRNLKLKIYANRISNETALKIEQKIKEFLNNVLRLFEYKVIEMTKWVHLSLEVVEMKLSNEVDSGFEILRHAYQVTISRSSDISSKSISEFKSDLLSLLYKTCTSKLCN